MASPSSFRLTFVGGEAIVRLENNHSLTKLQVCQIYGDLTLINRSALADFATRRHNAGHVC